jgi:hypothetical protein
MNDNQNDKEKLTRNWLAGCHGSALLGLLFPLGNLVGPLIVWFLHKDRSPEVMSEGKVAINFQMTATLIFLLVDIAVWSFMPVTALHERAHVVFHLLSVVPVLLGGVKAYRIYHGMAFEYPFSFKFLR